MFPLSLVLAALSSVISLPLLQEPPPVAVPTPEAREATLTTPVLDESITLEDGFDALEELQRSWAFASPEVRAREDIRERADAALAAWVRGERRAAVEGWTRLRLEVEGKEGDVDALLTAVLWLEIVDGGAPTRRRRAFYSNGSMALDVGLRVRALFDAPELAGRVTEKGAFWVQYLDPIFQDLAPDDPRRAVVPIAFDEHGHLAPVHAAVRLGPTGCWDCLVQFRRAETVLDVTIVENAIDEASERRAMLLEWIDEVGGPEDPPAGRSTGGERPTLQERLWSARWRAFHSRLALMTEAGSAERSAEFLIGRNEVPPHHLHAPIRWVTPWTNTMLEAEALAFRSRVEGRGPLEAAAQSGPVWRTFAIGPDRDVAAWVRVPDHVSEDLPPLVVVLHPEGFDEGWALALGGRGACFTLSSERWFGVLAVDNTLLAADPSALGTLLESVALELDVGAVYLMGAGTGGTLARRLAEAHPKLVAGVVVLPSGKQGAPFAALGLEDTIDGALRGFGL